MNNIPPLGNSFIVRITKSRIDKGLLAVPQEYASVLFPMDECKLNVLLEGDVALSLLRFVPATRTAKEARIYGLKEWFNSEGVAHGDKIEVVLLDRSHWLYEVSRTHDNRTRPTSKANGVEEYVEGRFFLRLHRQRERNHKAVSHKKRKVLASLGNLPCEVCGFDFEETYGSSLGGGFAECHHRSPLAQVEGEHRIRLSDLAIVCANCHRMLHRKPWLTVDQLRQVILLRRGASSEP